MKKTIKFLIISWLLLSNVCILPILAAIPEQSTPLWDNVHYIDSEITFVNDTGYFSASIKGKSGTSNITAVAKLYYKESGDKWVEIPMNWVFSESSDYLYIEEPFSTTSGNEYKVTLSISVVRDGLFESVTKTTSAICP